MAVTQTPGRRKGYVGTSHADPIYTAGRREGQMRGLDCEVMGLGRYFWCEFWEDFLRWDEDPTGVDIGNLYDHSPTGAPTMGSVEDGVDGQLQIKMTANSQAELIGYDWKDDLRITATGRVLFECIFSPVTLPTTNQEMVIGLCNSLAPAELSQNLNDVTRRIWFKFNANGVMTMECADGTTTQNLQVPQYDTITVLVGSWYLARIDMSDTGQISYQFGSAGNPEALRERGTLAGSAFAATDKLQPVVYLKKSAGVTQPEVLVDALYAKWQRRWDK